jgi:lysozyme
MDIDLLREELAIDEGIKHEVYRCSLGHKTMGIGRLITKDMEEWDLEVGDPVTPERVAECFAEDVKNCISDCRNIFKDFDAMPELAQRCFANMCYQLGAPTFRKFRKTIMLAEEERWDECAAECLNSRWARQTPNRAKRIADRLVSLSVPS